MPSAISVAFEDGERTLRINARPLVHALLLAGFVLGSSFLGLRASGRFFVEVWSASIWADFVFVGGSVVAAVVAYKVARRQWIASFPVSLILNWAVYTLSFLSFGIDPSDDVSSFGPAFLFVGYFGFLGLVFATVAPGIVATLQRRWGQRLMEATPPAPRLQAHKAAAPSYRPFSEASPAASTSLKGGARPDSSGETRVFLPDLTGQDDYAAH